jgi:hypothetical protein
MSLLDLLIPPILGEYPSYPGNIGAISTNEALRTNGCQVPPFANVHPDQQRQGQILL